MNHLSEFGRDDARTIFSVAEGFGKTGKPEKNSVRVLRLRMEKDGQMVNLETDHYAVAGS